MTNEQNNLDDCYETRHFDEGRPRSEPPCKSLVQRSRMPRSCKKDPRYRRRGFHFSVVIIKEVDLKLITLTLLALDITTEPSETNLMVTQFDSYKERVKLEAVFFNMYIYILSFDMTILIYFLFLLL